MSKRKKIAIVALAELFGRKLTEASVNLFVLASGGLTDEQFERAAAVVAQKSKFMPTPAELIEIASSDGVGYAAKAQLAFEELNEALAQNKPSLMSPLVAAICRQIGGFQILRAMDLNEFNTWKRKDFLASYETLIRENPQRVAAIAGPDSELSKGLLTTLPSREEIAAVENENRQKLLALNEKGN